MLPRGGAASSSEIYTIRPLISKSKQKERLLEVNFSIYFKCNIVLIIMPNDDEFLAFLSYYGYRKLNTISLITVIPMFILLGRNIQVILVSIPVG